MTPHDGEKFACKLKDFGKITQIYLCDIVLYLNLSFPLKNSLLSFMLKNPKAQKHRKITPNQPLIGGLNKKKNPFENYF